MISVFVGGLINVVALIVRSGGSIFNMPHWVQGLAWAFVLGSIFYGLPLWLLITLIF